MRKLRIRLPRSPFLLLMLLSCTVAYSLPQTYFRTQDTYIASGVTSPKGSATELLYDYINWALIKFNIHDISTVGCVKLRFNNIYASYYGGGMIGQVYRCRTDWNEATAVYSSKPTWKTGLLAEFGNDNYGNTNSPLQPGYITVDVTAAILDSMDITDSVAFLIQWKDPSAYYPTSKIYALSTSQDRPSLIVETTAQNRKGGDFTNVGKINSSSYDANPFRFISRTPAYGVSARIEQYQPSAACGIWFCDAASGYSNLVGHVGYGGPDLHVTDLRNRMFFGSIQSKDVVFYTNNRARMTVAASGKIGIGTSQPDSLLSVNGKIKAKSIIITPDGWSDHVFSPYYQLKNLHEVDAYIRKTGHLEGIPGAQEVAEKGVSIGDLHAKLLEKIEELTLYQIAAKKQNDDLWRQISEVAKQQ